MPRSRRPVHAEQLKTYDELKTFAKKFGQGAYNCLIFIGPPGRLKSSIITAETKGNAHLISGNATACEVFCEAQVHKDELLIIDDADGLYADLRGQRLLNALTNPVNPKTVPWHSNEPEKRGLEKTFQTTSKVCIIDNAWGGTASEKIEALEDRSRLFVFDPSPDEVHAQMFFQEWFTDDEVFRFIGDFLGFFSDLSVRIYVKAVEAKEAGEDWRAYILNRCVNATDLVLLLLEYEPAWKDQPIEDKATEFARRTKRCRATYFNRKKKMLERLSDMGKLTNDNVLGKWTTIAS